jgi:hypothetical protein
MGLFIESRLVDEGKTLALFDVCGKRTFRVPDASYRRRITSRPHI